MTTTNDTRKSTLWGLVDRIVGTGGQRSGTSFPATLILLGVVVVIFSAMGVTLVLSRRKAARLAAQLKRVEEEKAQAEENFRLDLNKAKRHEHTVEINRLDLHVRDLKVQIEGLEERNRHTVEDIAKITDWKDFVVVDKRGQP